MRRVCVGCGRVISNGSRCAACFVPRPDMRRQHREIVKRTPWCAECGATTDLTVDHIVPLVHGGSESPLNKRVLCRACNSSKGSRGVG